MDRAEKKSLRTVRVGWRQLIATDHLTLYSTAMPPKQNERNDETCKRKNQQSVLPEKNPPRKFHSALLDISKIS
jgi:hypothetical protein